MGQQQYMQAQGQQPMMMQPEGAGRQQMGQMMNPMQPFPVYSRFSVPQHLRKQQMDLNEEIYKQSKENFDTTVTDRVKGLEDSINQMNSKLACIKFKIERKCIKNGAREERRASIHKLEIEKNLLFHPKNSRSKSIPTINMDLRIEALKERKEDLLMRRSKISDEINEDELELVLPVIELNYNDIKRKIMANPIIVSVIPEVPKARVSPRRDNDMDNASAHIEEEKQQQSSSQHKEVILPVPEQPKLKIVSTYKYKTGNEVDNLPQEEEK